MARCLIAFPNRADAATLSGAPWAITLPVSNLQTRFMSQYARTTSVSLFTPTPALPDGSQCSANININFGQVRYTTAVALAKHNLSLTANVRVILWQDAANTIPLYDSGWQPAWPRWYDTLQSRWSDPGFLYGRISADDFGVVPAIYLQMISTTNAQAVATPAQWASIYIQDSTNTAGFIQVGRLYMAEDWTPVHNFTYSDTSLGWVDPTIVDTALDGTEYYEQRSKYREAVFSLKYMSGTEGVGMALKLTQNRGVSGDVLFVFDPANKQLLQQRSFVGRLEALNPLVYSQYGLTSMAFKIKELV